MARAFIHRREVLALAGGLGLLAAGAAGGVIACRRAAEDRVVLDGVRRLFAAIVDIVEPETVGAAYAADHAREDVMRQLAGKDRLLAAAGLLCDESRRAELRESFREDFCAGDVLVADRWVVSRSECIITSLWVRSPDEARTALSQSPSGVSSIGGPAAGGARVQG